MRIQLPISKTIAQRELMLRAMQGEDLRPLMASTDYQSWPEDVRTMLRGLLASNETARIDVGNNGTAMRFLTAYYAQKEGCDVVLDGCERMRQRPIAQLVSALQELGADIQYEAKEGFAPLRIRGREIKKGPITLNNPASTQFISALLLIGVQVETNCQSPYIEMTKKVIDDGPATTGSRLNVEADWSAAAFWIERQVLGLAEDVELLGLREDSWQGDKVCKDIFTEIIRLKKQISLLKEGEEKPCFIYNFSACPDLYPAVAVTCHELGIPTQFTGLESLRLKESDRISAIEEGLQTISKGASRELKVATHHDHRIAMAFMAAGYEVDDEACVAKSYPDFVLQLRGITRIVPQRGVNDDNKGKKWALHKLIHAAESEWLWLADDDVQWPIAAPSPKDMEDADMIILPLRMEKNEKTGHKKIGCKHLQDLQILEYAAIQALTMETAKHGHAVMCSGANLLVRRDAWLDCEKNLHPEIASGDDMFLLEAMKASGYRIKAINEEKYTTICYAEPTLTGLLRQRMRWAGKAPHYTDSDVWAVGTCTIFSNLLAVACPLWILGKWIVDMRIIRKHNQENPNPAICTKKTAKFCLETLLLTFIYPWYMLICLIGGLFRKSW